MICKKCGTHNSDTAKFCGKCGCSLTAAPRIRTSIPEKTVVKPEGASPRKLTVTGKTVVKSQETSPKKIPVTKKEAVPAGGKKREENMTMAARATRNDKPTMASMAVLEEKKRRAFLAAPLKEKRRMAESAVNALLEEYRPNRPLRILLRRKTAATA